LAFAIVGLPATVLRTVFVSLLAFAVSCSGDEKSSPSTSDDAGTDVEVGPEHPDADGVGVDGAAPDAPEADAPADAPVDQGTVLEGGQASVADTVRSGSAEISTKPRPDYGALLVATDGERSYVVESRRDIEPGPYGLPWRSRFRLAAYDAGVEIWSYQADPDDLIGDVVVHPSGELTLSLLRFPPAKMAYDLVRLAPNGSVIGITTLSEPATLPATDFGPDDPNPLFRMKADFPDALTAGWVRLLADGEGLVAAYLSFVDVPSTDPLALRYALGIETFDWNANTYVERWARVVDGQHAANPAAWAYDELRWMDQAVRPFLARDDSSGDILVGRAWNNSRCAANVATFAEFTQQECIFGSVAPIEVEWLPLAVTRFDQTGARLGTRVIEPDADAPEQVPFALAARDGQLGVVGAVVRSLPDGSRRLYENTFVDYDGYVAIYDADGKPVRHTDFNLGRGDVLAAMRWTTEGIVAVGSSGWDRWTGGMSISRGANPLFVWLSPDGTKSETRTLTLSDGSRHFNLHDLAISDQAVIGYGISDAPMTHSAGGGNDAARTFGPLGVRLAAP
jgi:hypothetical protein